MNKKQLIAELTNFGKGKKSVVDLICRSEFGPITIITALSESLANLSNKFDNLSDVFCLVPKRYKEVLDGLNDYLDALRSEVSK